MNNHTALDWIRMGNLDSLLGEDNFTLCKRDFVRQMYYMHFPSIVKIHD